MIIMDTHQLIRSLNLCDHPRPLVFSFMITKARETVQPSITRKDSWQKHERCKIVWSLIDASVSLCLWRYPAEWGGVGLRTLNGLSYYKLAMNKNNKMENSSFHSSCFDTRVTQPDLHQIPLIEENAVVLLNKTPLIFPLGRNKGGNLLVVSGIGSVSFLGCIPRIASKSRSLISLRREVNAMKSNPSKHH